MASAPARVVLDGALSVRCIAPVHAILLAALAENQVVHVACDTVESVDLSVIQLLFAAHVSAQQAGKLLSLAAPASGALRSALEQGGFLPASGADPFWVGES